MVRGIELRVKLNNCVEIHTDSNNITSVINQGYQLSIGGPR